MALIRCKQCGYENPDGTDFCEMCAEPLMQMTVNVPPPSVPFTVPPVQQVTVSQTTAPPVNGTEYFVLCPESNTKTVLPNGTATSFFCNGCHKQHIIDGFLWQIESRTIQNNVIQQPQPMQAPFNQNSLYLEEVNTHFRINIDKEGGTLGRYGKYGADFFQSRDMRTVSGEHCMITFEHQSWVLRHISRTNQTKYNGMILSSNEPVLLENGKILTLANSVSFIVRIV
jgi:hypothetical protein